MRLIRRLRALDEVVESDSAAPWLVALVALVAVVTMTVMIIVHRTARPLLPVVGDLCGAFGVAAWLAWRWRRRASRGPKRGM